MRSAVCRRFQIHMLQKALSTKKNSLLPYEASLAWEKELENFLFRSFCLFFLENTRAVIPNVMCYTLRTVPRLLYS